MKFHRSKRDENFFKSCLNNSNLFFKKFAHLDLTSFPNDLWEESRGHLQPHSSTIEVLHPLHDSKPFSVLIHFCINCCSPALYCIPHLTSERNIYEPFFIILNKNFLSAHCRTVTFFLSPINHLQKAISAIVRVSEPSVIWADPAS